MISTPLLRRNNLVGIGLAGTALVPILFSPYYVFVVNLAMIYILLAVGLNIVLGYAGQLAFANGALFGIGAYTTGLLRLDANIPFWLAVPAGGLVAAIVGVIIALPAMRLKGLYLALATIAFAQFVIWVLVHWDRLTHGTSGFVLPQVDFAPLPIRSSTGLFYVSLLITCILVYLASNMLSSRVGRAFVAVRESEHAAEALSIGLVKYKAFAYVVSALYAGLAGGLFVGAVGAVVPDQFNLFQIVIQYCMIFVGGVGSLWGAVLGAILITAVLELLRGLQELQEIGFGVLLLAVILFFPSGIVGFLRGRVAGWKEPLRGGGKP